MCIAVCVCVCACVCVCVCVCLCVCAKQADSTVSMNMMASVDRFQSVR